MNGRSVPTGVLGRFTYCGYLETWYGWLVYVLLRVHIEGLEFLRGENVLVLEPSLVTLLAYRNMSSAELP